MAASSPPRPPALGQRPRFLSRHLLAQCLLVSCLLVLLASSVPFVSAQTSSVTSISSTASGSSASASSSITNSNLTSTVSTSTESAYPTATYPSSWAGVATAPGPLSGGTMSASGPDDSHVVSAAPQLALKKSSVTAVGAAMFLYIGWACL
ncbi:hypothetical protein BCV69DRAFT_312141 [Microstroma glucosiphilum]|uniref:REJ domain-containing protein n=1 Tax=Pseudomicrostroma glucosiphilum TaxID=1684307 RepID=A0A316U8S2_9BASI|nr:hypothetical protein BCV69DRAFT_312141 [Pseudomicrostroma glucosiphilum]PWN21650.1 hypothetical protein BCV69DRAFT_312141 [Pseudomicrostroma glucosiphilum]